MKNENGVTLASLVITIIVIIILATISTYTGTKNIEETREKGRKAELYLVQQAVMQKYAKYSLTGNKNILKGNSYTDFNEINTLIDAIEEKIGVKIQLKDDDANNYYLLDNTSLAGIGIANTEDEYIVNYTTGEVLNKTKLVNEKSKEPLYIYLQQN